MTEEILIYNTPCTEEIFKQIQHYEFKRIWKKNLAKNNKNLFAGTIILLFAIMFFITEDYGFAGLFGGYVIATYIYCFSYYSQYKKHKKNIQELIAREISNIKINSKDVIWEFNPTHFCFKNYKSEYKFIWQEITYCILDDKYLYITASSFMHFILDKANIDESNLNKTTAYLEKKSQFKEV